MSSNLKTFGYYLLEKETKAKIFVAILYVLGVFGALIPSLFSLFIKIVPFALILSLIILLTFHADIKSKKSRLVFLFIYLLSFTIEVVGTNTGLIFGNYSYGNRLGVKLFNIPLIMGLNWLMLVYITSSIFERFIIHSPIKIVLSSSLMLVYDIILEKVAPRLELWYFKDGLVPLQNYLAWFAVSLILHSLIKSFKVNTENKLALILLISQFLFFLILSSFLK
jgi:bisanhydrobacterioruberin hydratase